MKKIGVKCKEYPEILKINQLHAAINDDNDIYINGSVEVTSKIPDGIDTVRVTANLCNEANEILYVLNSYSKVNIRDNNYFSFSISCVDVSRFIDMNDLAYAELYVLFGRKED